MDSFCQDGDIAKFIVSSQDKEIIKAVLKTIDPEMVPVNRRRFYFILASYFNPQKVEFPPQYDLTQLCSVMEKFEFTNYQKQMLFYSLLNRWKKYLRGRKVLYEDDMKKLFAFVDETYFGNGFTKYLVDNNIRLDFRISEKVEHGMIGYCQDLNFGKKCHYVIFIAVEMVRKQFTTSHIINGIRLYSADDCLLNVFLHEIIHLLMLIFCYDKDNDKNSGDPFHGEFFRRITFNLFGHSTYWHNLYNSSDLYGFTERDEVLWTNWKYIEWINDDQITFYGKFINMTDNLYARAERFDGIYSILINVIKRSRPDPRPNTYKWFKKVFDQGKGVILTYKEQNYLVYPANIIELDEYALTFKYKREQFVLTYDSLESGQVTKGVVPIDKNEKERQSIQFGMETYTITFGDQAENHIGMQKIAAGRDDVVGYTIKELKEIRKNFAEFETELHRLDKDIDGAEPAAILIIRKGAKAFVPHRNALLAEQKGIDYDQKAFMYGRVVNKHARHNVCFAPEGQEPDYEGKKGRIVAFADAPNLYRMWKKLPDFFGPKAANLVAEGNYYYDVTKCGIGYHGDAERRIVIALRLGAQLPLCYQWYLNGNRVGKKMTFVLKHGDMYVMSAKAVGTDWKRRNILTLRHAAGADKYTA